MFQSMVIFYLIAKLVQTILTLAFLGFVDGLYQGEFKKMYDDKSVTRYKKLACDEIYQNPSIVFTAFTLEFEFLKWIMVTFGGFGYYLRK